MAINVEIGTFNEMINAIKAVLQEEYENQRIVGTDYANVLSQSIQSSLALAIQKPLLDQDLAIKKAQELATAQSATLTGASIVTEQKKADAIDSQKALTDAQKDQVLSTTPLQVQGLQADAMLKLSQKQQFDMYGKIKKFEAMNSAGSMLVTIGSTGTTGTLGASGSTTNFWTQYFNTMNEIK